MAHAATAGGFHDRRRISPTGLITIVALHVGVIGAVALAKIDVLIPDKGPIEVYPVPLPPEPIPPEPKPQPRTDQPKAQPQQKSVVDTVPPKVDLSTASEVTFQPGESDPAPPTFPAASETIIPPPVIIEAARAKGDVRKLFRPDDYPVAAQQRGESGSLRARLDIAPSGKVERCTVTSSSGSRTLDNAACRILKARARFTPAKDSAGRPTGDSYVTPPITWTLVDG